MKRIRIAKYGYITASFLVIIIGCFILIKPETSLVTLCRVLGAVILVSGMVKLFGYFSNDTHQLAFQFDLALGALTILLSIIMLIFPQRFSEYLTVLASVFVIINAFFTMQNAIEAKTFGISRWWLLMIGAVFAFIIGAVVLIRPMQTNLFIMRFVGVALILDGIQNIIVALITIYMRNSR